MNRRLFIFLFLVVTMMCDVVTAKEQTPDIGSVAQSYAPFKRWKKHQNNLVIAQNEIPVARDMVIPESPTAERRDNSVPKESESTVSVSAVDAKEVKKLKESKKTFHTPKQTVLVRPERAVDDPDNKIEVNLERADLSNVLDWYSSIFKVDFLSGDSLNPPVSTKVAGNVISFHTHEALTKLQAWDLLLNLLNLFGLTLVPIEYKGDHPVQFRVMNSKDANKAALPSFVGTDWKELPDNDTKIRFVYFVENSTAATLNNIVKDFVSTSAALIPFAPLNALIFTDKSAQIKSIMRIVSELDSVNVPEAMSVLRLRHANVEEVAQLYQALVSTEQGKTNPAIARILGQKKQQTSVYFPSNTRVIAEKRTNALIILGTKEGINKVEDFILNHVDTELRQPYSPLYVYELQYANATDMANILTSVTRFATSTPAAMFGGVRDGDKFLRPMTFIADPAGNRLLIKAEKEDYLVVRSIIQELDVLQPQVNIEVLIVNVTTIKNKELGTQIRNKDGGTLANTVNFQTSGIGGIVTNPITGSIIGDLANLAVGQPIGTTLISLGSDLVGGVWALFKLLDTFAHSNIVSHPFLSSTNKYTAQVSLGETRRVQTGNVTGAGVATPLFDDVSANLTLQITPQINREGMINLDIKINIEDFVNADPLSATKTTKLVATNATVADKEVLAIGGILRNRHTDFTTKVPLLGNIPLIGWFFKYKRQQIIKDNLLVFISVEVFNPHSQGGMNELTQQKSIIATAQMDELTHPAELRDPVFRWFFHDQAAEAQTITDNYMTHRDPCLDVCSIVDSCERVIEYMPSERRAVVAPVEPLPSAAVIPAPLVAKKSSIMDCFPEGEQEVRA